MEKRLCKSNKDKIIAGVCGGIAEYYNWDPTIVRLVWAVITCFYGTGLVLYIVAALIFPERLSSDKTDDAEKISAEVTVDNAETTE